MNVVMNYINPGKGVWAKIYERASVVRTSGPYAAVMKETKSKNKGLSLSCTCGAGSFQAFRNRDLWHCVGYTRMRNEVWVVWHPTRSPTPNARWNFTEKAHSL